MLTGPKTLLRSTRKQFHTTPPIICVRRSRNRLVLFRCELLRQFFNTLTADYKYSRRNRKNLSQQVPMQTSRKLKSCSRFFIAFVKSTLNLEYFGKKDQSHSLSITEVINCETGSHLNDQKAIFHPTHLQTAC